MQLRNRSIGLLETILRRMIPCILGWKLWNKLLL